MLEAARLICADGATSVKVVWLAAYIQRAGLLHRVGFAGCQQDVLQLAVDGDPHRAALTAQLVTGLQRNVSMTLLHPAS